MMVSTEFLMDLEVAYKDTSAASTFSEAFLRDLESAFRAAPPERGNAMISSATILEQLGQKLDAYRETVTAQVAKLIKQRQQTCPDDPLFCPVSLFGSMRMGRLELAHTAALAWLLDPRKEHGFGTLLLDKVLTLAANHDRTVSTARVEAEVWTDSREGRMDIVVDGHYASPHEAGNSFLLVIEAKIAARESSEQLGRYEAHLRSSSRDEILRVFLSPDGRQAGSARKNASWTPVSFRKLAQTVWEPFGDSRSSDDLIRKPGYHYLRMYLAGVLQDILSWPSPAAIISRGNPFEVMSYLKGRVG